MPSLPTAFSFYLSYMNQEIQSIIRRIESVNNGEPWFGRAAYSIMEEVNAKKAYIKPNNTEHSLIELLYHMITWADFTLKRIEKNKKNDDDFLLEMVDYRKYNFRFLINGMIQHNIYHLGQIAYLKKLLD